ncbi:Zinc finger, C2H2-like protein [Corchorus olitorius]|uniref:Zinc finger, C2H2-like protein n=1 Tax=Corchorus olitorius TaxID=93759 RepID=A0A1R3K0Q8_9ROSI|nr:Zinc finger, C2H2-like protein [Corchorus olitorius]
MEKHRCKLCFKSFANGRALGGHMRSHMLNLPVPPPPKVVEEQEPPRNQPSEASEAASASAPSSSSEDEGDEKGQLNYGLRENPKRSVRLVDPEFVDAGSVVLQDRESETESSKNPTRRRSKRTRKILQQQQQEETKKLKVINYKQLMVSKTESWGAEPEPVSSISDTTTEEDVAFCLMMLSRDQWKRRVNQKEEDEEEDDDEEEEEETEIEKSMEETDESEEYFKVSKVNRTSRGKYRCETCNKVFKSYQALGGHRASHKKIKAGYNSVATHGTELEPENVGTCSMTQKKIHECPVCFRVFSSGQALGGHKRSHVTGQVVATSEITPVRSSKKLGDSLIDLNLPAPMDDDDVSQIELSAVSDAEFVNHIKC